MLNKTSIYIWLFIRIYLQMLLNISTNIGRNFLSQKVEFVDKVHVQHWLYMGYV